MRRISVVTAVMAMLTAAPVVAQQQVRVTVENLQPSNGFYFTPVWTGFHDGNFDFFDSGSAASNSLENLAEEGMVGGLMTDFANVGAGQQGVLANAAGFPGAPVIDPGEAASQIFNLAATERFFSFASMIIPTNDSFFGNDSGTAFNLYNMSGDFVGLNLELGLGQLWDAGTEVNNNLGAAFTPFVGAATDENGLVSSAPNLSNIDGLGTADGTTINFATASGSPVLRVSVTAVPEPSMVSLLGLIAFGLISLRRRS